VPCHDGTSPSEFKFIMSQCYESRARPRVTGTSHGGDHHDDPPVPVTASEFISLTQAKLETGEAPGPPPAPSFRRRAEKTIKDHDFQNHHRNDSLPTQAPTYTVTSGALRSVRVSFAKLSELPLVAVATEPFCPNCHWWQWQPGDRAGVGPTRQSLTKIRNFESVISSRGS
jgi:hypothetical protein